MRTEWRCYYSLTIYGPCVSQFIVMQGIVMIKSDVASTMTWVCCLDFSILSLAKVL